MTRSWLLLAGAIVCEVCGTTFLKLSEGFSVAMPSVAVVVAYVASFALLTFALQKLPLGLAYGIWGGAGTLLTTLIGVVVFGDPFVAATAIGLALIVAGTALMSKGDEQSQNTVA